ncbi:hypothetical protein HFN89_01290 [Rhizobium laguerreae]|nr:hypothetical protein [Rhizobium laguerreae]
MARARVRNSPGGGSKIDTLYYDAEQVVGSESDGNGGTCDKVIQKKIAIDLYMQKAFVTDTSKPTPAATKDIGFRMKCEETKDEVFGSDISAMIKEMRSKLDHRFRITWKRWFLVRINPARVFTGIGSGLELSWENIERGEAYDGSILMRRYNAYADVNSSHWIVTTWPENFVERGKMIAAIEATAENEALLDNARVQVDILRNKLVELLGPHLIMETLQRLASGGTFIGYDPKNDSDTADM